jgi:peptide/nickel transport system substrate-binding protein
VTDWWGGPVLGPDEVVYRLMRESQARIAGLLNGEIQIAQDIPYQDAERLSNQPNLRLVPAESLTLMFLGMNQAFPPWDNKLLRQAVAYAIDRDAIIQSVLLGYATRLDGAVGPGQFGYDPAVQPRYRYDPERARQLVAQAGFPNGVDVELTTPVGTFPKDKEAAEAIAPMLTAVGIRTKLSMPESSTRWANVQAGKVAFFYQARGSLRDMGNFNEYFETGVTKRINYSDARVDALWAQARASFDESARKRVLSELQSVLLEDVPVHFLWRNKVLWGVANSVDWMPRTDEVISASEIRVR